MNDIKKTTRGLWVPIIFFSLLSAGVFGVLLYLGATVLINQIGPLLSSNAEQTTQPVWDLVLHYYPQFWYTVFVAMMGIALVSGLLAWLFVRSSVRRRLHAGPASKAAPADPAPKKAAAKDDLAERRMFLHLFSLLQREGRLMDFLAEDLNQYEDAQIGSAVRAVHAGCLRIVQEYLDPQPVMDAAEGETIAIEDDFDPGAIKLTGKVVGQPPFKGILHHKGWQVGKLKLPTLSGSQNAKIITPAEVEL
jgi:hypothetical protein